MREFHYDALLKFEQQQQFIHDVEWLTQTKERIVDADKRKAEENEKRKKEKDAYLERKAARDKVTAEKKARYDAI